MFQVNDTVRYGTSGVCKITQVMTRPFKGEQKQYFVLRPVHDSRSTLFVPVDNQELVAKMRPVLTKEEVMNLIHAMPSFEQLWIGDEQQRKQTFRGILSSGDCKQAICMIKALHLEGINLREKGRKLRMDDERCLRDAERLLYDEFSLALAMEPEEVLGFIKEQLDE